MANFIIEDFKKAWSKEDNGLIKIILINVIIFVSISILEVLITLSGGGSLFRIVINKLMLPASFTTFILQPWSLISYFFLHLSFGHILWNMLFLYWFGKIIHDNIGNNAVISLYILGGIIGGLSYMALFNIIPFYEDRISDSLMYGASAGVFSVVAGSATLLPNYTFYLLFLGPVRIKYIALFYILLSFLNITGSNAGGEIAHIGGALIGYLFIKQLQNGVNMGDGVIKIEMHFLPDVYVTCETCNGARYNRETLEIKFKAKSIADVLDMTVEDAQEFFKAVPSIREKMDALVRVGLGYIKVGQQATTLSGGEAQRVKLSKELSKRSTGRTLYILDEPTTGLHFDDVRKLLEVLHELVDQGNTVIVIEHNLDVIKTADHILDIGPEGGDGGGELIAYGSPEMVAKSKNSHTARYLKPLL